MLPQLQSAIKHSKIVHILQAFNSFPVSKKLSVCLVSTFSQKFIMSSYIWFSAIFFEIMFDYIWRETL